MKWLYTILWFIAIVALAFVLTYLTLLWQNKEPIAVTPADTTSPLSFHRYPVEYVYDGVIAPVNFSTLTDARMHEKAIVEGVAKGVNFAGHYMVVSWECGTSCVGSAIVDARNGDIVVYNLLSETGVTFNADSRLLLVNPVTEYSDERVSGRQIATDYYVLENNELFLIAKEVDGKVISACTERVILGEQSVTGERRTFASPCQMPFGWFEVVE